MYAPVEYATEVEMFTKVMWLIMIKRGEFGGAHCDAYAVHGEEVLWLIKQVWVGSERVHGMSTLGRQQPQKCSSRMPV